MNKGLQKNNGFTLLEVIIVISIITLVIPMMISLFIVNLRSYSRVRVLSNVKKNGDAVLDQIENKFRSDIWAIYQNSAMTQEVCTNRSSLATTASYSTETNEMYFKRVNGTGFSISNINGKLILTDNGEDNNLTDANIYVSFFRISCMRRSNFTAPLVTFEFTISNSSGTRAEDQFILNYYTKFKIR